MTEISVNLPPPAESYSIVIEQGLLARVGQRVGAVTPHARCLLAMDANVVEPHGAVVLKSLRDAGYEVATAALTADEKHKTLDAVESLYRVMLDARLERRSPVIALGGGIVGDVAGYAAATYLRGVPLVHVPTTLLAMVDASIGGKTGVNFLLPKSDDLGKNLIGAFWQPKVVLVDPSTLRTLNARDLRCGLAECIKHAVIADASLLTWIAQRATELKSSSSPAHAELIARSASMKAAIVAEDERENGRRALLNLGHTFAHAIESIAALNVRHGEAVAIGLNAAAQVAREMARISDDEKNAIISTLIRCDLTLTLPDRASIVHLMRAMTFDKKSMNGRMRLVLPRGVGSADVVDDVPEALVRDAWRVVGASA